MTFEQANVAPKNDDQRNLLANSDSKEVPYKFEFPDFEDKRESWPMPSTLLPDKVKLPESPPFDAVGLMEGWETAYDKTKTNWIGGLTHQQIDTALAGTTLDDKERKALQTIKENFDDLSKLDGDALSSLSKGDITLFKILVTNTARDIQFHEKSGQFLTENKRKLDKDKNGTVDWFELNNALTSLDFKEDQLETITYLGERASKCLHYADVDRTKYGLSFFKRTSVNEYDFAPGALSYAIDQSQSLAYSYKFADDYRDAAGVAALGAAALVSGATKMGFLAKTGTFVGSLATAGGALMAISDWQGPRQQDAQDERIKRLMTKVANFNY